MSRKLSLSLLILAFAFMKFAQCCNTYSIQSLCNADAGCTWQLDPNNQTCQQKVSSCIRYEQAECGTVTGCTYNSYTGNCEFASQCTTFTKEQCNTNSNNCVYQGVGSCQVITSNNNNNNNNNNGGFTGEVKVSSSTKLIPFVVLLGLFLLYI